MRHDLHTAKQHGGGGADTKRRVAHVLIDIGAAQRGERPAMRIDGVIAGGGDIAVGSDAQRAAAVVLGKEVATESAVGFDGNTAQGSARYDGERLSRGGEG